MNPARTFGPDLVGVDFTDYLVYVAGPLVGAIAAVGVAFVLRGRGGAAADRKRRREPWIPRSNAPISHEHGPYPRTPEKGVLAVNAPDQRA